MIPPLRHRISLWLGIFITTFLLWASWHSQYRCPRFNLPLGHAKGSTTTGTGRAITGYREDHMTLLIYGHKNLSQLFYFSVDPKHVPRSKRPQPTGANIYSLLFTAEQSGFRTLLIRDTHVLTAWFTLWIGGLAWQHLRLRRLANSQATAPPENEQP